jgi:hypothetical protein
VVMREELLSLPELNLMQPAESFLRAALAFSLVGDLLELGDWKKRDATAMAECACRAKEVGWWREQSGSEV